MALAWMMWILWTAGVALRWLAGVQTAVHPLQFPIAAALELAVGLLLLWQVTPAGPKYKKGEPWEAPVFTGLYSLAAVLAWQFVLTMRPLASAALPAGPDRTLISLAIWIFAFPVVAEYIAKFFKGLIGAPPPHRAGLIASLALAFLGSVFAVCTIAAVALAIWSLRVLHRPSGIPKITGVWRQYPVFARIAYCWLAVAATLNLFTERPGMLGASRHAFTVGFLATLIFSIGLGSCLRF